MADSAQSRMRGASGDDTILNKEYVDAAAAEAYSRPAGTVEDMFVKSEDLEGAYDDAIAQQSDKQNSKKGVAGKIKDKFGRMSGHHEKDEGVGKVGCMNKVKNLIRGPKPREEEEESATGRPPPGRAWLRLP